MYKVIGIDISKKTFDVNFSTSKANKHLNFSNDQKGFKKFYTTIKPLERNVWVLMEASGPYSVCLATYLYEQGVTVSVINPLVIRRFSQMQFYRAKTDKKDASIIREYGELKLHTLKKWKPASKAANELKQMRTALELLQKQLRQSYNQLEAFKSSGSLNKEIAKVMKQVIAKLKKSILQIEEKMQYICVEEYPESFELLTSIPSIGSKTAIMLIAITDDFKKFEHYKQLIAYVGLAPRVYQSGTSVNGKGHICKMGKAQIRKLLYMCAWTAKRYNKTCREMYERLKAKGKPERVIKIAIANKLLKIAFAVGKSRQKYTENYDPKICF